MAQNSRRVFKYSPAGKLIKEYDTMRQAQEAERIGYKTLNDAIESGERLKGAVFSHEMIEVSMRHIKQRREAWEGANGLFDINGWAKICD